MSTEKQVSVPFHMPHISVHAAIEFTYVTACFQNVTDQEVRISSTSFVSHYAWPHGNSFSHLSKYDTQYIPPFSYVIFMTYSNDIHEVMHKYYYIM